MKTHLIQPRELFGPPERQAELRDVWRMNDGLFDITTIPDGRPTFTYLFTLCKPDAVNIIANSDIYFYPEDLMTLAAIPWTSSMCFALSRWDIDVNGNATLWEHSDSQDAWIVYGTAKAVNADFTMGVAGCDNRLAHELEQAGYVVTNPSRTIHACHLHLVQWRSYLRNHDGTARGGDKIERIPPPYKLIRPTEL